MSQQDLKKVKVSQGMSSKESPIKALNSKTSNKNEDLSNSLPDYESSGDSIEFPEQKPSK